MNFIFDMNTNILLCYIYYASEVNAVLFLNVPNNAIMYYVIIYLIHAII